MKALQFSALALILSIGAFAQAQKPADNPACASIAKSCEAAGFQPGEHKKDGKGLWVDCIGAIAKGKTVAGVTAAQADAKACMDAAKAQRAANKATKK